MPSTKANKERRCEPAHRRNRYTANSRPTQKSQHCAWEKLGWTCRAALQLLARMQQPRTVHRFLFKIEMDSPRVIGAQGDNDVLYIDAGRLHHLVGASSQIVLKTLAEFRGLEFCEGGKHQLAHALLRNSQE